MNSKKKKRALRILQDSEGFFIIHKNRKVRLTSASTVPINKNKLRATQQVIVNNYLNRKVRSKKTAEAPTKPLAPTKPTGPTDSDNFIRHSLVNQLEQLRHLQRNPPQQIPQSITVNPGNVNVHPANINVHPANITINNKKESHDPQEQQESLPVSALRTEGMTQKIRDDLKAGVFFTPNLGKEGPPLTPQLTTDASNILKKLFYSRENLNTLLNYADIKSTKNADVDRTLLLKKYPEVAQIIINTDHRTQPAQRALASTVTDFVRTNKRGAGGGRGIYDSEIDKIMDKYKPVYQGTFMRDELKNLKPAHKMAFIMNTDPSTKEGKHWVACYLDAGPNGDKSLEYYDSFGKDPPQGFDKDMKRIVDELNLPYMLKYKVNRIVEQKSSDNCGFHSMRFLINRMKGNKFTEATKYNVLKSEEKAKSMKIQFGFI